MSENPRRLRRRTSAIYAYDRQSVDEVVTTLRNHFAVQYPRFTFEGQLGQGAFGTAFRIIERLSENTSRRLAVKRPLNADKDDDLRNEINYLNALRGSEHVVRILASRDEPRSTAEPQHLRRVMSNRRLRVQDSLEGLGGPLLGGPIAILEYLENADVQRLYDRLIRHDQLVPNRVLWSFFLCLTRACISLAYPLNGTEDQESQLETVPTDGRAPSNIEHADLSKANIMFGTAGGGFEEHNLVPPLKFIDFGRTREGRRAVIDNVWAVSRLMIDLIARQQVRISRWITEYQGFETRATEILHHGNGARYPTLDDDMRDFLARCLADEPPDRLSLADMLQITENAVRTKTTETDEAIQQFIQMFIYNADT